LSDKPKSVLDVIGWCKELEHRLEALESSSGGILASGQETLKKDETLINVKGGDTRDTTISVKFEKELEGVSDIIPSIVALDSDSRGNTIFDVYPKNLSSTGFDLIVSTWSDSRINVIVIKWIAIA
jgi:hypothetical protein